MLINACIIKAKQYVWWGNPIEILILKYLFITAFQKLYPVWILNDQDPSKNHLARHNLSLARIFHERFEKSCTNLASLY